MPIRRISSSAEAISRRISQTREARGMTASGLAKLVGVTPTAVWNWEKNSITPRGPALESIAKVLGVTKEFLLTGNAAEIAQPPNPPETIGSIIEDARGRLALATGLDVDRIKLNVQFTTE